MATKPSSLPQWDLNNVNINEPPVGTGKANGWTPGTRPPAQWMNWWMRLVWTWVVWLDAFESDAHEWTGYQTFNSVGFEDETTFLASASVIVGATFNHEQAMTTGDIAPRAHDALNDLALVDKFNADGAIFRTYRDDDGEQMIHTLNAKWNGTQWVKDSGGQSRMLTFSSQGIGSHVHGGASPFNTAAWGVTSNRIGETDDTREGIQSNFLQIGPGPVSTPVARLSGSIDLNDSVTPAFTDAQRNVSSRANQAKVIATFTCNGSAGPTIENGFNLTSVVQNTSTGLLTVNYAQDFLSANAQSLILQVEFAPSTAVRTAQFDISNKSPGFCVFGLLLDGTATPLSFGAYSATRFTLLAFGDQ